MFKLIPSFDFKLETHIPQDSVNLLVLRMYFYLNIPLFSHQTQHILTLKLVDQLFFSTQKNNQSYCWVHFLPSFSEWGKPACQKLYSGGRD